MEQQSLFKVRDLRQKTQFKIDDAYLNGYARICKKDATVVYNSLCRHAEFFTQKAFPSQEKIAYEHNISVRTVQRAIKKLIEFNIIATISERQKGKFSNYVYILLDKSEWKKIDTIRQNIPTAHHTPNTIYGKTVCGTGRTKDNTEQRITNNKDNKDNINTPSINYLKNIPELDLKELSDKYSVSSQFIKLRAEDVIDYCESKGKKYKNYKATLRNFIKSHLEKHPECIIRKIDPPKLLEKQTPEEHAKARQLIDEGREKILKRMPTI